MYQIRLSEMGAFFDASIQNRAQKKTLISEGLSLKKSYFAFSRASVTVVRSQTSVGP